MLKFITKDNTKFCHRLRLKLCQTLNQEEQSNPIPKDRDLSGCDKKKEE